MRNILRLFFVCLPIFVLGQANYASSLQASGGYTEDGFGLMADYDYYINRKTFVQFSLFFALANDKESGYKVPYTTFNVQPSIFFNVIEAKAMKPIEWNLGGGGILGYETINGNSDELPNGAIITAESGFIYGLFIGSEVEYHLTDEWSLLLKMNQHYHVNSSLGQFQPYIALGVKYYLF